MLLPNDCKYYLNSSIFHCQKSNKVTLNSTGSSSITLTIYMITAHNFCYGYRWVDYTICIFENNCTKQKNENIWVFFIVWNTIVIWLKILIIFEFSVLSGYNKRFLICDWFIGLNKVNTNLNEWNIKKCTILLCCNFPWTPDKL